MAASPAPHASPQQQPSPSQAPPPLPPAPPGAAHQAAHTATTVNTIAFSKSNMGRYVLMGFGTAALVLIVIVILYGSTGSKSSATTQNSKDTLKYMGRADTQTQYKEPAAANKHENDHNEQARALKSKAADSKTPCRDCTTPPGQNDDLRKRLLATPNLTEEDWADIRNGRAMRVDNISVIEDLDAENDSAARGNAVESNSSGSSSKGVMAPGANANATVASPKGGKMNVPAKNNSATNDDKDPDVIESRNGIQPQAKSKRNGTQAANSDDRKAAKPVKDGDKDAGPDAEEKGLKSDNATDDEATTDMAAGDEDDGKTKKDEEDKQDDEGGDDATEEVSGDQDRKRRRKKRYFNDKHGAAANAHAKSTKNMLHA